MRVWCNFNANTFLWPSLKLDFLNSETLRYFDNIDLFICLNMSTSNSTSDVSLGWDFLSDWPMTDKSRKWPATVKLK